MTPQGITTPPDVLRSAVAQLLSPEAASLLRADTPILGAGAVLGLADADAVALVDAIDRAAQDAGASCVLVDRDLDPDGSGVLTCRALEDAIARRWVVADASRLS